MDPSNGLDTDDMAVSLATSILVNRNTTCLHLGFGLLTRVSIYLLTYLFTYASGTHTVHNLCGSLSVDIRDIDVVTAISRQREKALAIIRERTCW